MQQKPTMQAASTEVAERRLVGAHVSASGGCFKAVANARSQLGPFARSFAFFVRPRLTWRPLPPLAPAAVAKFHAALVESPFEATNVVVHGSYLINVGSHDAELRRKSVDLMVEEVQKCEQLGLTLYVFHPGASTGHSHTVSKKRSRTTNKKGSKKKRQKQRQDGEEGEEKEEIDTVEEADEREAVQARQLARQESIQFVSQCVVEVMNRTSNTTTLVLENTCGQGNVLGRDFEELRQLLDAIVNAAAAAETGFERTSVVSRLGVCLDTCHAFASGYAMDSPLACDAMVAAFDAAMGAAWLASKVLKVVHVNDSKDPMGSRRDRHATIGRGRIGMPAFQWLMKNARFKGLPMILETPRHKEKVKKTKKRKTVVEEEEEEKEEEVPPSAEEEIEWLLSLGT